MAAIFIEALRGCLSSVVSRPWVSKP